jgi:uncharacterized Zn finger protein (UPF0148 family)
MARASFGQTFMPHVGCFFAHVSNVTCEACGVPAVQVHDGTTTPLNQFNKDPDSLITRVTWKDEQDKVRQQQHTCGTGSQQQAAEDGCN